jgi:hypothetical protein
MAPASPPATAAGTNGVTATPASVNSPARMFSQCGRECIQAPTIAAGVMYEPVPQPRFCPTDSAAAWLAYGVAATRVKGVSPGGQSSAKRLVRIRQWSWRAATARRARLGRSGRSRWAARSWLIRQRVAAWTSAAFAAFGRKSAPRQPAAAALSCATGRTSAAARARASACVQKPLEILGARLDKVGDGCREGTGVHSLHLFAPRVQEPRPGRRPLM